MHLVNIIPRQGGASLIEVMVSLTILAVGLLGMAQLQNRSSQDNQMAYYQSQALFMADDLVERMRSNPSADDYDDYLVALDDTLTSVDATQCETASCSANNLARWDLKRWKDDLAELLPQGDGSVKRAGDRYIITIQLDDSRGKEDTEVASFDFEVQL